MTAKHWLQDQIIGTRLAVLVITLLLLGACQVPTYSYPSSPSSASGSSTSQSPSTASRDSDDEGQTRASQASTGKTTSDNNQSSEESIENLDQALDESLEDFDNSMGHYETDVKPIDILSPSGTSEIQTKQTAPSFEHSDENTIIEENTDLEQRASSDSVPTAIEKLPTENSTVNSSNESSQGQSHETTPIPDDIGDGQGDNIVQRQIREAALEEKDPELRDRLWEEYRKIKKN